MSGIDVPYTKGHHQLADHSHAWLVPDGTWGWSNAGLITGRNQSMLVDTLFDLAMTQEMLDGFQFITDRHELQTVVNTHANGDHWFGNELVVGAEIVTSRATAAEMDSNGPDLLLAMMEREGGVGRFTRHIFKPFDFTGITPTRATRTFDKDVALDIGGTEVQLFHLGPAHTAGDTVAFVPSEGVLYAGDLLFIGGTPISWAGPITNWITACDRMVSLNPQIVVPGHGPIVDVNGIQQVRAYLSWIYEEASGRFARGMTPEEAVSDIDLSAYAHLDERGRIAQNVLAVYYELDPNLQRVDTVEVFGRIAKLEGFMD